MEKTLVFFLWLLTRQLGFRFRVRPETRQEAVVCCLPCKLFSVDRGTEALLEQRDCRAGYIDKAGEHILDMHKVLGSPMNTAERKENDAVKTSPTSASGPDMWCRWAEN